MKKIIFPVTFAALLILVSVFSCRKELKQDKPQSARLSVYLTDDPANYDAVYIDVRDVMIHLSDDSSSGWQSLPNVAAGSYNLLELTNGNDTLLADSDVPNGSTITQIRLILGPNNYIMENGNQIPLTTPSAQQSGLKINVHQKLDSGMLYSLVLDFDAARSVIRTGNNRYMLKPVIRASFQLTAGRIKGVVTPDSVRTSVLALRGVDTITTTFTDTLGNYQIVGLDPGTYNLHFNPVSDTTFFREQRNGINVTAGTVTVVDTVRLHQ